MAMKSDPQSPRCAICGNYILPGEDRAWTYGKTTFYHRSCLDKEVIADVGPEEEAADGRVHSR